MTSREKVLNVEVQIRAIVAGKADSIMCPFCGCSNDRQNGMLCCDNLADVVTAVLDYIETGDRLAAVERVLEHLDKQRTAVLN